METSEKYTHWTPSARECYKRGGVCSGCIYESFFAGKPYKCKMKESVVSLVKAVGAPPKVEPAGYYEDDDELLN